MPTRAEIKTNAKQALTGKWGKGALIVLCYVIASIVLGLLNIIPFIGSIAMFVLEVPMMLGLIFSFIKLRRGEDVGAFDFVKLGFQNFGKSWSIFGRMLLKMIGPIIASVVIMIVAMISGVTAIFAGANILSNASGKISGSASGRFNSNTFSGNYSFNYGDYSFSDISYTTNPYARSSSYQGYGADEDSYINPYARGSEDYGIDLHMDSDIDAESVIRGAGLALGSLAIMGVLMIAMWVVSIWATCKGLLYVLSYYIAYDNPEMTAKDAVQKSEDLMKGNRWKFFVLQLSFIGWAILACITFGIGYFWLIPYMMITFICFYEALLNKNNGDNGNNANYNMNTANNVNYVDNNVNGMNNMNYTNNEVNGTNNINYVENSMNNMNYANNNVNTMNNTMNQQPVVNNTMTQNTNQAPEVTEYVPVNFEQNTNQFNQPTPAEPVTPMEQPVNQYNPVTPAEPTVNQYNPVTPTEPTINPTIPDQNQINPMNNDFNNQNNNNM